MAARFLLWKGVLYSEAKHCTVFIFVVLVSGPRLVTRAYEREGVENNNSKQILRLFIANLMICLLFFLAYIHVMKNCTLRIVKLHLVPSVSHILVRSTHVVVLWAVNYGAVNNNNKTVLHKYFQYINYVYIYIILNLNNCKYKYWKRSHFYYIYLVHFDWFYFYISSKSSILYCEFMHNTYIYIYFELYIKYI